MNALAEYHSPTDASGLVRRFLGWAPRAFPHERAAAVNALARAYLYCDLKADARVDAEIALTRVLDDPEPLVRRALAEAFASARAAPRHVVLALARDVSEVSRAVLSLSPLLSAADLVDCVAVAAATAQSAIARRARLAPPVIAALADVGERAAVLALIGNLDADLRGPSLWRLFDRFKDDAAVRSRLTERPGLPATLRAAIAALTTIDASAFDVGSAWNEERRGERIARDGREQAFVAIAADCPDNERADLVAWLRAGEHLTVGLLMRALAGGDVKLLAHGLADMSGLPLRRVDGLLRDPRGQGFASLYRRAHMPAPLLPAFRIAVEFAANAGGAVVGVNYPLTLKILREVEARDEPALSPVVAMLWRLAGEGARLDAREFAELALAPDEGVAMLEIEAAAAEEFEGCAPPVLILDVEPGNENFAPPVMLDPPAEAIAVAA